MGGLLAPARLVTIRAAAPSPCGDRLMPVPADIEHDGWSCARPHGHLPGSDHLAEDGTTW
ncbi:MAG TPA: hypothetical protein VJT49_30475 [Amycolatopsis sp.]|uniref:hypothetical protein n=1 Tax=Amycolatopsis sp. TaxID=37632 RepID=UPI002B496D74|nr:hypothetical protein [Amycolatopsis sp.]HKS49358.1 hypothetical protein [Amycolatopsis sp.]